MRTFRSLKNKRKVLRSYRFVPFSILTLRDRRQLPQNKFLDHAAHFALPSAERKSTEHQARPSIRVRIIRVGERCRDQVAPHRRNIDLALPVVAAANEWIGK